MANDDRESRRAADLDREVVDLASRHPVGQPMTRIEALAMRGASAIGDVPPDAPP